MSGHVVYACACLNIKLHLANKYLLNNHNNDRAECFIRLNDPSIEGRQFELGMGGVQAVSKFHCYIYIWDDILYSHGLE